MIPLLLATAAAAQDAGGRAEVAPPRTAPRFGAAPERPRHALWVQAGSMYNSDFARLAGPGGEYEVERIVARRVTLATRLQHWQSEYDVGAFSLGGPDDFAATHVRHRLLTADLRARYYFGARPMSGWYVSAGAGYVRAALSAKGGLPTYRVRHGLMASEEVGYTRLFGDGAHNRLGVTLAFGVQHYYFQNYNPSVPNNPVGPRLRIGWTF